MSGTKKDRHGEVAAVRYAYEPVRVENVQTGARVWTNLTVRVTDEGPDFGRLVHVRMDPEEALTWAQRLIDVAGETQRTRDDVGHTP